MVSRRLPKVRVLEVDLARQRIALTMKSGAIDGGVAPAGAGAPQRGPLAGKPAALRESAMAAAFAKLQRR